MSLHCGEHIISLDRKDKLANLHFISHAHADHTSAVNSKSNFISSEITANLIKTRKSVQIRYTESMSGMTLLNAGHILGSKQLYVDHEDLDGTITYSGDYQMQSSYVAEPIEIRNTDYLIIDSTYPDPRIEFDDKSEVTYTIQKYVKEKLERGSVLFQTYSLGKAQEIIKILNEVGIVPLSSRKISQINEVYNSHGCKLEYIYDSVYNPDVKEATRENYVQICEHNKFEEYKNAIYRRTGRRVYSAIATGFAQAMRFNTDVQFALSDHADFKQAVEYINACNPKKVYTYGSNSYVFAHNLSKSGLNAVPYSHGIIRAAMQMEQENTPNR